MIYCTSDLHGKPLADLLALLQLARFGPEDELFILGDVIDRGDAGVELLRWAMAQPNVEFILGNHEAMLLSCSFLFEEITEDSVEALSQEKLAFLSQWMRNGCEPTLRALRELSHRDPGALGDLLDYLREAPLYEALTLGEQEILLCHSFPVPFVPGRKLRDYPRHDWLWCRPTAQDSFLPEALTVFGHTHTHHYGEEFRGRIYRGPGWINIDTGKTLSLLRLDDLEEFYLLGE